MHTMRVTLLGLLVLAEVSSAAAQAIDRPPRATTGPLAQRRIVDPNVPVDELSLAVDFFGSYDDNVSESGRATGTFTPQESAYVGSADAELQYRRSRGEKFFEGMGRTYLNRASTGFDRFAGAEANAQGGIDLGPRAGLTGGGSFANEPTFLFNAFGPLASQLEGEPVTDATPVVGITQQRWLNVTGAVGFYRDWTTRQRMEVLYNDAKRTPVDGIGLGSRAFSGTLRHGWNFRRNAGLQFSYVYSETRQSDEEGPLPPLKSNLTEVGLRLERPLSPQRSISVIFGGGAAFFEAFAAGTPIAFDYVVPTYFGQARFDVARTWTLSADVRRNVTILQGLSPEPFASNALSVRADGLATSRMQLGLSGAYSRGAALITNSSTFKTQGVSAQLQFLLSRCCSLFTTYRYYKHDLRNVLLVPNGFPPKYDRNSVQLGLTVWFPLHGNF
jgi:hypothetical protein